MGFLPSAVVDPHFSERRRLPRLLSTLAGRPDLLGVQLHTLPAGHRYSAVRAAPQNWPAGLQRAIEQLVKPGPVYL